MKRQRNNRKHPKSLVEFVMEAIEEAAPGRGAEIYWLGFRRFYQYVEAQQRAAAERELAGTAPRPEEWTIGGN
jgi:hypothetical protein